jgi:hypothetical protein
VGIEEINVHTDHRYYSSDDQCGHWSPLYAAIDSPIQSCDLIHYRFYAISFSGILFWNQTLQGYAGYQMPILVGTNLFIEVAGMYSTCVF